MRSTASTVLAAVAAAALGWKAVAAGAQQKVTMTFSDSTNLAPADVEVKVDLRNSDGSWATLKIGPITIPPLTPAATKRDLIKAEIAKTFKAENAGPKGLTFTVPHKDKIRPRFLPGATGENPDKAVGPMAVGGAGIFQGFFDPRAYDGQPAIFTAGIVTDVGELTVNVSAQELNFQTEGPIICQALFQRLAPRAPQYGAQVQNAGDRLQIIFDPNHTVTVGGVVFGTTSPSPGCQGMVELPPLPPLLGDMNCDGVLDFADIHPFVMALSDPDEYMRRYPDCDIMNGDINGDRVVDFGDINDFVELLSGDVVTF